MGPLIFSRSKCGNHNDPFNISVGEILLLLFILNKSFLLLLCIFHCLFQISIVEVDLGARVVIWVC